MKRSAAWARGEGRPKRLRGRWATGWGGGVKMYKRINGEKKGVKEYTSIVLE